MSELTALDFGSSTSISGKLSHLSSMHKLGFINFSSARGINGNLNSLSEMAIWF